MVALLKRVVIAINIILEGDKEMIAMLFAQRIMKGKLTYEEAIKKVPLLADQIKEELIDSGLGELTE